MKIKTFLKGCLGLAIIYLVCLPICIMAEAVETVQANAVINAELGKNATEPAVNYSAQPIKKSVKFNEIATQRLMYGNNNEKHIDMFCVVK